ncbi:hypothetical protein B0H10DRAFT_987588 [Mycena sp. CBHHK59/15]|nr:hypothetical protein B0H10DRAFT_987588 [Mycena sp. CBHHK59/15]
MATEPDSESHLQRGQACYHCRRRKMRCDGRRPICGQCSRASRPDDCEYTDNQGRSRVEILEEDISRIETRIYELEHPEAAPNDSVLLYHPYQQPQRRTQMPSLFQVLESTVNPPPASSASPVESWWNSAEPPIQMIETLLDAFLPYASDWGFFLDISHFRRDALLQFPIGHHLRPTPALLATVYLIGITFSDSLKVHEKTFLSRALSSLPVSLSGLHPHKAIHALQAEILLSNYFFSSGRFLEGKYHVTAAVSLSVSSALHKIRSEYSALTVGVSTLRPPANSIEEGERVDACWTTLVLDKSWAVALATHPNMQDSGDALDTPWPLEAEDYANGGFPASLRSSSTISKFLDGQDQSIEMSTKTVLAKAVILWERANNLMVGWKPDMPPQQTENFSSMYKILDDTIDKFRNAVMSLDILPSAAPSKHRTLLVGRSVAHAATIQLHGTFAEANHHSKQKCLAAARSIIDLIGGVNFSPDNFAYINTIMGTIWVAACQVVVDQIATLKLLRPAWAPDVATPAESELNATLDKGFIVISHFAGTCSFMNYQITKIQEVYSAV